MLLMICFSFAQLFRLFNQERRLCKQMKTELIDIAHESINVCANKFHVIPIQLVKIHAKKT